MRFSGGVPQWLCVSSGEIALLRFLFLVTCIFPEDIYLPVSSNLLVLGFFSYLHLISPLCIPREPLSDVCHKPLVWPTLGFRIHRCTAMYFGPGFLHLTQCFWDSAFAWPVVCPFAYVLGLHVQLFCNAHSPVADIWVIFSFWLLQGHSHSCVFVNLPISHG